MIPTAKSETLFLKMNTERKGEIAVGERPQKPVYKERFFELNPGVGRLLKYTVNFGKEFVDYLEQLEPIAAELSHSAFQQVQQASKDYLQGQRTLIFSDQESEKAAACFLRLIEPGPELIGVNLEEMKWANINQVYDRLNFQVRLPYQSPLGVLEEKIEGRERDFAFVFLGMERLPEREQEELIKVMGQGSLENTLKILAYSNLPPSH